MTDRDLRKLSKGFTTRAARLEAAFFADESLAPRAFAAVSLYAAWEEFSRRLLYASGASLPYAGSGRRIERAPGLTDIQDVDSKLRTWKNLGPKRRLILHLGPPGEMAAACQALDLTNRETIVPAILSQNSPADELRKVRNFVAHQNPDTASKVTASTPGAKIDLFSTIDWLAEKQPGGQTRFGVWVNDLCDVARACSQ